MPDIIKSADNACECVIKTINGMPRLVIDGKTVAPVLFFGNTDINCAMVTKQVKMAAENGIHLHSVIYNLHFTPDKPACCLSDEFSGDEYGDLDRCLDAVISGDPDARIFLRVKVGAYFKEAPEEWKDELITFADGSVYPAGSDLCLVSTSSDRWADEVCRKLRAITEYMRSDERYAAHLACVHLENCEWFEYGFRENGSDVSRPANLKFARWQLEKYGADYKPFAVPRDLPNNISSELYENTLLLKEDERRFVDYFDFINELVASRIEQFARAIKEASGGKTLVIAFYGYLFELCDCQSGHYMLQRLLHSSALDGFAGPVSYADRTGKNGSVGATSAYMTVMDSITRSGKIWFQESDQRTFVNGSPDSGWLPNLTSLEDIYNVHRREIGDIMLHGCGLWAMDLMGTGWLSDRRIWRNIGALKRMYDEHIAANKVRAGFDVVIVADERAESVVGQPSFNGISGNLFSGIRFEAYRSGLSFAFAEINDVAEGRFADGKLFVFLNPYRIEHDCALRLADALYGKNSVWMYGFGTTESRDAALLTGMETELCASGSTAFDSDTLDGAFVPPPRSNTVTHRWKVKAGADKIMGGYDDGIKGAFAESAHNGGKCWFWGGTSLGRENLRAFAERSGVMLYTDMPDMTVTDGKTLVLCAASSGEKNVHTARGDIRFALNAGETRILDI